jgi:hypothetical protein
VLEMIRLSVPRLHAAWDLVSVIVVDEVVDFSAEAEVSGHNQQQPRLMRSNYSRNSKVGFNANWMRSQTNSLTWTNQ